jgi:hypothetical protein
VNVEEDGDNWYIDALDALGGYAFASFRKAGEESWEAPSVAIYPPAFVAEPIASGATALAATRGSFQRGLVINGAEVPFQECVHLSEFVRRLFVSGSAGSGGAGPLIPQVPVEPSTGSDGEAESVSILRKAVSHFDDLSRRVRRYATQTPWWKADLSYSGDFAACLQTAGLLINASIMSTPVRQSSQVDALARIDWACAALGLPGPRGLPRLMAFGAGWWALPPQIGAIDDVLSDLPIPQWVGTSLNLNLESCSLFHILALGCAAPIVLLRAHSDALALFLFAASLVARNAEATRNLGAFVSDFWVPIPQREAAIALDDRMRGLHDVTVTWLESSLPRFAFDHQIESAIQGAVQLRYAS